MGSIISHYNDPYEPISLVNLRNAPLLRSLLHIDLTFRELERIFDIVVIDAPLSEVSSILVGEVCWSLNISRMAYALYLAFW